MIGKNVWSAAGRENRRSATNCGGDRRLLEAVWNLLEQYRLQLLLLNPEHREAVTGKKAGDTPVVRANGLSRRSCAKNRRYLVAAV